MRITVNVFGSIKGPFSSEVDLEEGATVADVVAWLRGADRLPQVFEECRDVRETRAAREAAETQDVLGGLLVVVNHVNVSVLDGPHTALKEGDRVTVLTAMAGG
ncbi:MAG: MoaD/ThiS family protein [Firmicutes bacterium]|nr:MoaD/ThiS family protein [Bacillota bacterium]MDH7494780.1 MoaD/ThiS family protein [Bacillota bacterium]